jgi:hypothetical protein
LPVAVYNQISVHHGIPFLCDVSASCGS